MTKQELIDLIEDSGGLVKEEGQLYHTDYLFDEEHISSLADAIIARQNEQLKEFVEWWLKSLDEGTQFWETQEDKHIARQMLDSIKNERMCLIDCYQKFLEEQDDDNK